MKVEQGNKYRAQSWRGIWRLADWRCSFWSSRTLTGTQRLSVSVCWCGPARKSSSILGLNIYLTPWAQCECRWQNLGATLQKTPTSPSCGGLFQASAISNPEERTNVSFYHFNLAKSSQEMVWSANIYWFLKYLLRRNGGGYVWVSRTQITLSPTSSTRTLTHGPCRFLFTLKVT